MATSTGLSPRVRGNRGQVWVHLECERSIPARTGEPGGRARVRDTFRVYPRAYGGTLGFQDRSIAALGLSPRVRGNRRQGPGFKGRDGSIPARTGEPGSHPPLYCPNTVYPRAYGGTPGTFRSSIK